jgi:hypothetical protein
MPMHDWTRVEAGIYHAFHHRWISAISDVLNTGLLPKPYHALPEQYAAGFGPDVLTLEDENSDHGETAKGAAGVTVLQARPGTRFMAESSAEFYRRKQKSIAVRHVSGDRTVAMVEIVSPGNKSGRRALQAFVNKAYDLLADRIHLLIIDPFPPGRCDPNGVHSAIWEEIQGEPFQLPADKPLTLVAYECDMTTRAYIEPVAVGDALPDMALFLEPNGCIKVPVEATYQTAFSVMPQRWRQVLESD